MISTRFRLATLMIVVAAILRVVPHPWNFTPVGAMALFAGATFSRRREAFLVPMATMFLGDLLLEFFTGYGLHSGMPVIYGCFAVTVVLGFFLKKRKTSVLAVGAAATFSATFFFVVTNYWQWLVSPLYARTFDGLVTCYVAGLPFYRNMILADLIYTGLLLGTFVWMERRHPVLQEAVAK